MQEETKQELVSSVLTALSGLEYDVSLRNDYINTRDRYLYGDGLFDRIDIPDGADRTLHNYLLRVVDVMTAQLMGRAFNIYPYYDKEDISAYADPEEKQLAILRNKKRKADADGRKKVIEAIIRDNGGYAKFKHGARIGSAYGETVFKQWGDYKNKKVMQVLIEDVRSVWYGWKDSNFRERDFTAYVYQVSYDSAHRLYGNKLGPDEDFDITKEGYPFVNGNSKTSDPLSQQRANDKRQETDRDMVTYIDLVGFLPGWGIKDGQLARVKKGEEQEIGITIVGGRLCETITDAKKLPRFYRIPNRINPRRAYGESDLPQSAIEINETIIQLMSDQVTWANKNLFKIIQAKGFTIDSLPSKKPRKQQVVAMAPEQSLEEMQVNSQPLDEFRKLLEQHLDSFVRVTGIGRVLFDDPTLSANSNQALITMMKPVIDIIEDKQSRWEPVLVEMFTDALYLAAEMDKNVKEMVDTDDNWFLCVEWPSILRREDATYQTMWLNLFNANAVSLETYHEKLGIDSSEEIDRLRDEMTDQVMAAILGRQLPLLAAQVINPPAPPQPKVSVNLRGDLTPMQEGEIAAQNGFNSAGEIGPQGQQGLAAQENVDNQGFIQGNAFDGGTPIYRNMNENTPQPSANPTLTADQNTGQSTSQPGSGAPQVSPEGAVNQVNQRRGY